tara:strand:- start:13 stop:612 length:600 start_codon:yes stop_codon:yes gene_type:complete
MSEEVKENLKMSLDINTTLINKYSDLVNSNNDNISEPHRLAYELAIMSLESKQCNEPYEKLLTELFNLTLNPNKHDWDGWDGDSIETSTNIYEMKPTRSNPPTATINDDSMSKIEKQVCGDGQAGWLVLASIDVETYSFSNIYKFPIEIYHEDRIEYINKLMVKNANQVKQTRSTYSISISKSVKLCEKYNKKYYVWKK